MNKDLISRINKVGSLVTSESDNLSAKRIKKSNFDKTLIGFVSEKVENDDGTYHWIIQVEGAAYKIKPERCNITDTGQKVRLFLPNHSYKDKYAEVITDYENGKPDRVVKVSDNEVHVYYKGYKQIITAEGSGNERYNFQSTIEKYGK